MIDLQMIEKGEFYRNLKPSYIIFLCPFDLFGKGRHKYTFRNLYKEDTTFALKDETTKLFLNAKGKQEDVSQELKVFLDYMVDFKRDDDIDMYYLCYHPFSK